MNRINRRSLLKSGAAVAGSGLLLHNHAHAEPAPVLASSLILETANRFLASLDNEQRAKATFSFDSDERLNWHFIPKVRKGLPLREMTSYQKHLASALLSAGLSQIGYIKAVTIMSLEDVLKTIENASDEYRNPEKYFFSIFGVPSHNRSLGLPRRRTPSQPELYGRRGEGDRWSQLLWRKSGRSAARPAQRSPNARCRR